jgi:tetratricopeptide (TPR) repeat protein
MMRIPINRAGTFMIHRSSRQPLAIAVLLAFVAVAGPVLAAPADNPPAPPPNDEKGKKSGKSNQKNSAQEFRDGYRRAHQLIQIGDYVAGIPALLALGQDDHPDVANYLGFAHRKIGNYGEAKSWYERALAADPLHVRTWSYYGMWHVEQGNLATAADYLVKVRMICGNEDCKEFKDLERSIGGELTY